MKIEEYRSQKKYGEGVLKRKLGIKKGEKVETGDMLRKMQEKKRLAIMGLI